MKREEMIAALKEMGVTDSAKIEKFMSKMGQDDKAQDMKKSISDLREAFKAEHAEQVETLEKAIAGAENTAEAVQKGADQIVSQFAEQHQALCKALADTMEAIAAQGEAIEALGAKVAEGKAEQAAKIEAIEKSLDTPVEPKAVTGAGQVIDKPGDTPEKPMVEMRDELLAKCVAEVNKADTPDARRRQLGDAVSQLYAYANPDDVAKNYNL